MKHILLILVALIMAAAVIAAQSQPYQTNFPLSENPISENGNWINGKAVGLDWADCRTTPGFAFGTQSGNGGTNDSTCVLSGMWGSTQYVCATMTEKLPTPSPAPYEEVELRLRVAISPHSITGYEVTFQASTSSSAYIQIVRWNGPLNDFTYIGDGPGQLQGINGPGIHPGDKLCASMIDSTIRVYINGKQVNSTAGMYSTSGTPFTATDGTYTTGSPGMGFFLAGTGTVSNYGFTNFAASETNIISNPPLPPTNLHVTDTN